MLRGKRPDRAAYTSSKSSSKVIKIRKGKTKASASVALIPRLGHRVGDKVGRKLSSVVEEGE